MTFLKYSKENLKDIYIYIKSTTEFFFLLGSGVIVTLQKEIKKIKETKNMIKTLRSVATKKKRNVLRWNKNININGIE